MKKRFAILSLAVLSGCAHSVHEVHTSDFTGAGPIHSGRVVSAQTSQFVILGFKSETDYVNEAYMKLMSTCPDGTITGITTQYSTSLGLLSWTNKILMQGLCLKAKG